MYVEAIERKLQDLQNSFFKVRKQAEWYDIVHREKKYVYFEKDNNEDERIVQSSVPKEFFHYIYDYFYEAWTPKAILTYHTYYEVYESWSTLKTLPSEEYFLKNI